MVDHVFEITNSKEDKENIIEKVERKCKDRGIKDITKDIVIKCIE